MSDQTQTPQEVIEELTRSLVREDELERARQVLKQLEALPSNRPEKQLVSRLRSAMEQCVIYAIAIPGFLELLQVTSPTPHVTFFCLHAAAAISLFRGSLETAEKVLAAPPTIM